MFAESIHSVADTVNQIILAFGLHKSAKVSLFPRRYFACLFFYFLFSDFSLQRNGIKMKEETNQIIQANIYKIDKK